MLIEERAIFRALSKILKQVPDTITSQDARFLLLATDAVISTVLQAEEPFNKTANYHQQANDMLEQLERFLDKHKENHVTSREADNADMNILTPLEIQNILNQNNLTLNAYYSNQRYVCRVTDRTTGAIASLSSSCETLSKAVSIAVYNAMSHAHA